MTSPDEFHHAPRVTKPESIQLPPDVASPAEEPSRVEASPLCDLRGPILSQSDGAVADSLSLQPDPETEKPSRVCRADDRLGPLQIIAERVCADLKEFESATETTVRRAIDLIKWMPLLDHAELESRHPQDLRDQVRAYAENEKQVHALVNEYHQLVEELGLGVKENASREFRGITGWCDSRKLNERIAFGMSALGLTAGVGLLLGTHASIDHLSFAVGDSFSAMAGISGAGAWTVSMTVLSAAYIFATLGVMGMSYASSYAWGAAKTAVGALREGQEGTPFVNDARSIRSEVIDRYREEITHSLGKARELSGVLRPFFTQVEEIRAAASSVVHAQQHAHGLSDESDYRAFMKLAWKLGHEADRASLRLMVAEQQLLRLRDVLEGYQDAMMQATPGTHRTLQSRLYSLHRRAHINGPESALESARTLYDTLHSSRAAETPRVRDKFRSFTSGLGEGLVSVLMMSIATGQRPDSGLFDTVKGMLGLVNFGRDRLDGPTLQKLFGMVLETEERDAWKRAGKIVPNVGLFVFKKVYFIMKLEREELERGELKPAGLHKEMAKKQGIQSEWQASRKELTNLFLQTTVGALAKLCIEKPLRVIESLESRTVVLRDLDLGAKALLRWYHFRESLELNRFGVGGGLQALEKRMDNGEQFRDMPLETFKRYVLQRLIAFEGQQQGITPHEIEQLFEYWEARQGIEWLQEQKRQVLLRQDMAVRTRTPKLAELWDVVEADAKNPPLTEQGGGLVRKRELARFLDSINEGVLIRPSVPEILHATLQDELIIRDRSGRLLMVSGTDATHFLRACLSEVPAGASPFTILKHADRARILSAEYLLGVRLTASQRGALLKAHYERDTLGEGGVRALLHQAEFYPDQLGGVAGSQRHGIVSTGIVGKQT